MVPPPHGLRALLTLLLAALAGPGPGLGHKVCRHGEVSQRCGTSVFTPMCFQPLPSRFPCVAEAYVMQDHTLYRLNLTTGSSRVVSRSVGRRQRSGFDVNAIGYNILDDFIYGVQNRTFVRINSMGVTDDILHDLPSHVNMGDFDDRGHYWFSAAGRRWGRIDLHPRSPNYGRLVDHGTSQLGSVPPAADWAYTPRDPDHFYGVGVQKGVGTPVLVRWSIHTHHWESVQAVKGLLNDRAVSFGAVVSTSDGIIYAIENKHGGIVRFDITNPKEVTHTANGPASRRNDGTRCLRLPDEHHR